jgi:N-acetyl-gamma-glutamyl-phosphate reductase
MGKPAIFIDGEAGTTGLEIRSRLSGRDDLDFVSITPDKRKDEGERRRLLNGVDLAVLCLPDDAAREAVALVENPAVRVLDASSAHRTHPDWTYGFPELLPGQADRIRAAKRVSNPGCYPTGAVALIRPLVDAGLVPATFPITVDATEGYSGGGRQMIEAFEGRSENPITDPVRLYGLELKHKHTEEMRVHSGLARQPIFIPMVGKWLKGELVHVAIHLWALPKRVTGRDLHDAISARFAGQRFVRVMPLQPVPATVLAPETLNGTNMMELFVFENPAQEQALLVARLDNLGKGASGAAAQNIDVMLGLDGERPYALDRETAAAR